MPQAAHRTPPGSSARKRSVSGKCFICAKAKRQQQMFYLCESEATATNVLSVRKRSDSNKCFNCAKAKRQRQSAQSERKSTTRYGDEPAIKTTSVFVTIKVISPKI
ncbi:hypothetical protein [Lysinibacillus xylanilyticus]|uniref:hypothetical protein n=1 Tax=Lysinibacillus xylanilyticus TaxID=582475 RepID=UPI003CFBF17F